MITEKNSRQKIIMAASAPRQDEKNALPKLIKTV
jgi:hypothetical protein